MKVFVGYDTREDIAYQVCKHSIETKSPDADVRPLKQQELRDAGWYTRPIDKLASTEFTSFGGVKFCHRLHHTASQEGITLSGLLDDVWGKNLGDNDVRSKSSHG